MIRPLPALAATALLCLASAPRAQAGDLTDALLKGKPSLDLRLRHEHVGQGNFAKDAEATTLRAAAGYTTARWLGFDAGAQAVGVIAAGSDRYASTGNGVTDRPVVPDPQTLDLNQGWLRYTTAGGVSARLGRQQIVFDNARHLGNSGWRQDAQSFDGLYVEAPLAQALTLRAAHLGSVHSFRRYGANLVAPCAVAGPCSGSLSLDGNLANLAWEYSPALRLAGYGYWLDFGADTAARRDTRSLGLRASGRWPLGGDAKGGPALVYALEAAEQRGIAQSPDGLGAGYRLAELGLQRGTLGVKLGYELLGSRGGYGYQTPLATLHAFNGWADQFLTTPAAGLRDAYVQLDGAVRGVALTAAFHDYRADANSARYGREWNLQALRPLAFCKGLSAGLKWARYEADTFPVAGGRAYDSTKAWAWLQYQR